MFFACPAVYMNCTVSGSTLLPLPVCKSACDTFIEECASFIETLPAAYQPLVKQNMPNCTGINTVTGEPFAEAPNCIDLGLYYAALNDTHNALHGKQRIRNQQRRAEQIMPCSWHWRQFLGSMPLTTDR